MRVREQIRAAVDSWRARHWLRSCAHVGAGLVIEGKPTIGGGKGIRIGKRFYLRSIVSPSHMYTGYGGTLEIGDDVIIGHGAAITAYKQVRIGSGTRIGPHTTILDTDFHGVSDRSAPGKTGAIVIGRGVLIGSHVIVLRGTVIGDGAVIGAGSLVSGKVPPGARVSGVPARIEAANAPARELHANGATMSQIDTSATQPIHRPIPSEEPNRGIPPQPAGPAIPGSPERPDPGERPTPGDPGPDVPDPPEVDLRAR